MSTNQRTPVYPFAAGGFSCGPGFQRSTQFASHSQTDQTETAGPKGFMPPAAGSPALSPGTSRDSSPVGQAKEKPQECWCQRPQCLILCASCGYTFTGRVRRACNMHPGQIYLMDNVSCPACQSSCLKEYSTC